MRKFTAILAACALSLPVSAQLYVDVEKDVDCSVFIQKQGMTRAQQGMAISGDYIFSFEDGGHVNIYSFKNPTGKPLADFDLESKRPDNHSNNAEFGVETAPGGSFPLVYISVGKPSSEIDWTCFVESITHKGKKWSSKLVQTIVLDGNDWDKRGYASIFGAPSWLVDRERGEMWVFSAIKRTVAKVTKEAHENLYVATKFRIPALSEGPEVRLTVNDILDQVVFPYEVWFTQAGCVQDGKIYYCYGVGKQDPTRPSRIRVYDTDRRIISARYELQEEIPYEMEDIAIRDGWMYVNTNVNRKKTKDLPCIYKLSLPKAKEAPKTLEESLRQDPEKAGGIYYIDSFSDVNVTAAPAGYKPFYITGYFRHGARHMDDNFTYPDVYNTLKKASVSQNLTALGESVWKRVEAFWPRLDLRVCDLTMVGYRQSKDLGRRMADNYPEVFGGDPYVKTVSTSVVRVSETMHGFNLGLQSRLPGLEWDKIDATRTNIRYMNPYADGNPDKIALDQILRDFRGEWYQRYKSYALSMFDPEKFLARLFVDIEPVKAEYDPFDLMWRYWLAASVMQNLDETMPLWDVFTEDEIIGWTKAENYKYYMQKGPDPVNLVRGWGYGTRILRDIMDSAQESIRLGRHGVDLRFGHDGVLMATMTALHADDWATVVSDPDAVSDIWQVWNIPMNANLQLVFYKSESSDEILVKAMLNERDCKLPFEAVDGVFYRWSDMYPYYQQRFDEAERQMAETAKTDISGYPKQAVMHAVPSKK
ncbi:MAG: histidine phosphatase family protein [Bacteroidales bacterium]|nr:histidine phosphatase family protein [Bacteroidales bacterium]